LVYPKNTNHLIIAPAIFGIVVIATTIDGYA
jgi:hypothetical protein